MRAPGLTSTLPSASVKLGSVPCAPYSPRSRNCSSLILPAAATRLRTLTWLAPSNTTPLRLTISTVPGALICPWIWLGRPAGSLTRFSTAHSACWRKSTVVSRPTLKVCQLRMARSAVWLTVTVVRPFSVLDRGASAWVQPRVSACVSTCSPPATRPSGTPEAALPAAWRAAACAACCAAIAAAVRFRLPSDCCNCWRDCVCCRAAVGMPATLPSGNRPLACVCACAAPLAANQPGLKAAGAAWTPPAASISASACASGASGTAACLTPAFKVILPCPRLLIATHLQRTPHADLGRACRDCERRRPMPAPSLST